MQEQISNNPLSPESKGLETLGKRLWLITPKEYEALPKGTLMTNIFGERIFKGEEVDLTTRYGHLPFGFLDTEKPENLDTSDRCSYRTHERPDIIEEEPKTIN